MNDVQSNVPSTVPSNIPSNKGTGANKIGNHDASFQGQSFIKEINLKGEFDRMTETINPKKEEKKETKYQCGACQGTFDEKYKRCPHCGAEF